MHAGIRAGIVWAAALATGSPAWGAAQVDSEQIDVVVVDDSYAVPDDFTLRVRVTKITPPEPTAVHWRRKGEGMGGSVIHGAFSEAKLAIGQWSPPVKVPAFAGKEGFPQRMFLTVTAGQPGRDRRESDGRRTRVGYSTDAELELEFRYRDKVVKTLREAGPDGGTVGVVIPVYRLTGGRTPADPQFLAELTGILEYATRRAEWLERLPWASWPRPRKYAVINNVSGYGQGVGYGVRHTNRAVVAAECRSLRQLGVNGFRTPPQFLWEMIRSGQGFAADFRRACIAPVMGYPVPTWRPPRMEDPEAGCPYAAGVAKRTAEGVAASREVLAMPVQEVWGLTVDEIGAVVDRSPEGKGHLGVCPRCAAGFRELLRSHGLTPGDFGSRTWAQVAPAKVWRPKQQKAAEAAPARQPQEAPPDLTDPGQALLAYWTLRFNNHASARLFAPLRDAFAAANAAKREALAAGRSETLAARQPWAYSYALRGNTFLMKGHSLDFFDFYRLADNAFVYETSNRGPRVWGWDSYLCDVGRVVSAKMDKRFGVYIKPHRGAPIQRMLAAVSRGAKMIYWYTYGPDYHKGDSFSQSREALAAVSKAAALLGKTEDVLYGSRWMRPAAVAVVKPRSSELWMRLDPCPAREAAWENAKWTYTALQHAHVPVDPLDEEMLAVEDLSRYKAIYVSGPNLTRAAAAKLAAWVAAGGTLYTSGWGLVRDEANQPLKLLQPVLGLATRRQPEMYYQVSLYGATQIESYTDVRRILAPVRAGAGIVGGGAMKAAFAPVVGREALEPLAATKVVARFADGAAAVTCNACGKGKAYVVGFFAGLEYSAAVRHDRFNMARDFDAGRRSFVAAAALERVQPVVDASLPTVEGVLLLDEPSGRRAVTLANWAYRVTAHRKQGRRVSLVTGIVPAAPLTVTIRGAGAVRKVTSAMLERDLEFRVRGAELTVRVPRLEEGDVLLLE